jgi:hypothetical protein
MAIKAGYIDNERVYVFDWLSCPLLNKDFNTKDCQVFKHRDIVKTLNRYLKGLEKANDQNMHAMLLLSLINTFESFDNFIPYRTVHESEVIFDDEKSIKKTKLPRLNLPRCNASPKDRGGLKIIDGGRASTTY